MVKRAENHPERTKLIGHFLRNPLRPRRCGKSHGICRVGPATPMQMPDAPIPPIPPAPPDSRNFSACIHIPYLRYEIHASCET